MAENVEQPKLIQYRPWSDKRYRLQQLQMIRQDLRAEKARIQRQIKIVSDEIVNIALVLGRLKDEKRRLLCTYHDTDHHLAEIDGRFQHIKPKLEPKNKTRKRKTYTTAEVAKRVIDGLSSEDLAKLMKDLEVMQK